MCELPEFINLDELDEICRTCGVFGELLSMYEQNNENLTFADMIMDCASIKLNCNDGFPRKICLNCVSQVKQAYAFKRRCEKLDRLFHLRAIRRIDTKPMEIMDMKPAIMIEPKIKHEFMEELITINSATPDNITDPIRVPSPELDIVKEELQFPEDDIGLTCREAVKPVVRKFAPVKNEKIETGVTIEPKIKHEFMEELITVNLSASPDNIADPIRVPSPQLDIVKEEVQFPEDGNEKTCRTVVKPAVKRFAPVKNQKMKSGVTMEKPYKCELCGKSFKFDFMLKTHMIAHSEERPYKCQICGKPFRTPMAVKNHQNIIHNKKKPYKCEVCEKDFSHPNYLKVHMTVHTHEKTFICNVCGERFEIIAKLKEHYSIHTADSQCRCKYCGKLFRQQKYLDCHLINAHSKEPEVASDPSLRRRNRRGYDQATRTPENYPFNCDICNKRFDTKLALRNHEYYNHAEKKYLCSECGKAFTSKTQFITHSNTIHNGVKKYGCVICSKSFVYESSMTKHMRIHTGEKPYECNICHSEFYQLSHLKQHSRVHDGLKPYECEICGRHFSFTGNLRAHKRIHNVL